MVQVLDISAPSSVALNCTPGIAETNAELCTSTANINVNTNNATGYTLYMNTTDGFTSDLTNSAITPSATISTLSQSYPTPNFPVNAWGYTGGIDKSSESGGYNCTGTGSSNTDSYCPVLAYNSESSYAPNHTIKVADEPTASSTTDITFGAKVNTDKPSGTYATSVTFTAVANYVPPTLIMQDFDADACSAVNLEETYKLTDIRDGTKYTVAKLKDGNCWMTQNLELGEYGTPMNLTSDTSNVSPSGYTLNFPYANNSVYKGNSNHYGNYYDWMIATAGSGTNVAGEDAPYSICPKNWRLPQTTTVETNSEYYKMLNPYITTGTWVEATEGSPAHWEGVTTSQFTNEPVSLVFSGYVDSNGAMSNQGSGGYWWSSTSDGSTNSFDMRVNTSGHVLPRNNRNRSYGFSIRCMIETPKVHNGMYMQDITPDLIKNTPTDVTYTVKDKRDETEYTVSKLKGGNLWMTQNLELGQYGTPMNLTSELSSVSPSGYTLNLPYANNSVYKGNSNHYGNFYNWMTATAGSGTSTVGEDAPYSVCPKGWRLPRTTTVATDSEYYTLLNQNYITTGHWVEATESSSAHWEGVTTSQFLDQPVSLVFSGNMSSSGTLNYQGYSGYWWSSTSSGSSNAFYLYADTNGYVYPRRNNGRSNGFSVRCLVPGS